MVLREMTIPVIKGHQRWDDKTRNSCHLLHPGQYHCGTRFLNWRLEWQKMGSLPQI
uniref:Uncharacterized protein n=1 Tax=Setaria viridis TaxID=4556 RepID=A0A4U6V5B8_SETVI|nr:hypothetical protein SEVIR_4G206100v2 [Setaria viridis]